MVKTEQTTLAEADENIQISTVESAQSDIKNFIYVVRNQQVMIDSDLAMLYQVETRTLNQAVKETWHDFQKNFVFNYLKVNMKT
jgi:hypothetical protein